MERPLSLNTSAPSIENAGLMLEQRNDTEQTRLNKHLTCSDALLVNRKHACIKKRCVPSGRARGNALIKGIVTMLMANQVFV